MSALDILIRLVTTGQSDAQKAFDKTGKSADELDKKLGDVGANDGLEKVGDNAKDAGNGLDAATQKAQALTDRLESVRNGALAVAVTGAAALALGEHLSDSFVEADRLGGRLNSLMKGKGLDEGIEKVKVLGNEIAGLTGGDDDNVSAAIAGAIASGRLNGLREYGIVIDGAGQAAIAAAGKISEQAKSQEILNQVLRAGGEATKNLRENMDASTATLGEWSVRVGNLEEGMGKGSAAVKAGIINNILSPILSVVEASPALQETVGGVLEIGGAALSAGGSLVAFGAQAGQMYMGLQALRAAKLASAGADVVSAVAADTNAVSQGASALATAGSGTAAVASSAGHDVLAVSEGAAALAADAEAVSVGVAGASALVAGAEAGASSAGHDVLAVSEGAAALAADVEAVSVGVAGAASVAGGAGAGAGALGFGALAVAIWAACAPLLVFVAIAAAAALAMYGLDKAMHASEDADLQKNIEAGNATNQKRLDNANAERKKRGQSEITVAQWQAMESDDPNAMTPETANHAATWNSGGQGSGAPTAGGAPDYAQLQKMFADAKAGSAPAMSTPGAIPIAAPKGAANHDAEHTAAEAERTQKALQRSNEKAHQLAITQTDAKNKSNAEVELAQLQADTDLKIKQLEARGAAPVEIARVRGDAEIKRAQIEGEGLKGNDDLGRERAQKVAQIKAKSMVDLAAFDKSPSAPASGKSDEYAAMRSYLENGGDVNQYDADANKKKSAQNQGAGAGVSRETSVRVPMPQPRQTPLGGGKIRLEFIAPAPIVIDNPLARHLEEF